MAFPQLKYPIVIATVSAAVFVFCGFLTGMLHFLTLSQDQCEMTYMFEWPEYIPVPTEDTKYSKYKLYVYGEGHYANMLRSGHFNGIPVLFLPGNAGCHKQVRSFASMSYRMHEDLHKAHHFNYFTIDFNEELSGLYGGLLYTQTEYTRVAIRTIQHLYKHPTKVILIGHSMGGLVAKSVFLDDAFDYTSVDIIVTLSTPHNIPPFNFDWYIHSFYREWADYESHNTHFYEDKAVISVGSGVRDRMIQPHQTVISQSVGSGSVVNVLTTHIPGVQVSPDHLQAVWCRQFVKKLCLLTFDLIEVPTLQIVPDISTVKRITRHHLLSEPLSPTTPGLLPTRQTKTYNIKDTSYSASVSSRDGWTKYIITPKLQHTLHIVLQNPPKQPWLYYCTSSKDCQDVTATATAYPNHFSHFQDTVGKDGRYVVYLNAAHSLDKRSGRSWIHLDQHPIGEAESVLSSFESTSVTVSGSLVHTLHLPCMTAAEYWVSLKINVVQATCSHLTSPLPYPVGRLAFSHEDTFSVGKEGRLTLYAQLLTVTPDMLFNTPQVVLLLDPACTYQVEIETDSGATAANLIRYKYHMFGGLLVYVTVGICTLILGNAEHNSILYLFIQDITNMYVCILITLVKVSTWLFPQLVGAAGLDWISIKPEILIISLLAMYTSSFIVTLVIKGVLLLLTRLCQVLRLTRDTVPFYFTPKFQTVLCLAGLATSGSVVNTLNLLLYVLYLASRPAVSLVQESTLLLHVFGVSLQIPTLISWVKNLLVHDYWLHYDHLTCLAMLISSFSYVTIAAAHPTTPQHASDSRVVVSRGLGAKLSRYLDVLKFLTLSFVVSRTYLVPGVLYSAVAGIALCFSEVNVKLKNS